MHILDLQFQNFSLTIAAFLLETKEGLILFETGPHSVFPKLKSEVEKLGFQIEDIQHVFLTHIHLDHAGAAWALAEHGATIYVHPLGAPHLARPERLMESARRIYQDQMDTLWGQMNPIPMEQIVQPKDGEAFIFGDHKITSWFTPGHAVHHIAYQIGDQLIAGDVAGVRIDQGMVIPPCPPPDINIEDWQASINILRSLDLKEIFLTHFGKITDIEDHLDHLEKILLNWANWIKPYFDQQADIPSIIPHFQKHVAQQLKDFGIDEAGIARYESANPAWMSVSGLMRYWKKKTR